MPQHLAVSIFFLCMKPPPHNFRHPFVISHYHITIPSCPVIQAGHLLCPSRTFHVFHAGHLLGSRQDISCVPRKTSRVFQVKTFPVLHARHLLSPNQEISCVPIKTFLCSTQDISSVPINRFPVFQARQSMCNGVFQTEMARKSRG